MFALFRPLDNEAIIGGPPLDTVRLLEGASNKNFIPQGLGGGGGGVIRYKGFI